MNRKDILEKINAVFNDITDNQNIVFTEETKASDIEEWDSLSHIQMVVKLEKDLNIRFTAKEIQGWKNIGEMIDSILAK
jgi:acyl carrier protein